MEDFVPYNQFGEHNEFLTPTERLSVTGCTDDDLEESGTGSDFSLASLRDLLFSTHKSQENLHAKGIDRITQQKRPRHHKQDAVEIPESPRFDDHLDSEKGDGVTMKTIFKAKAKAKAKATAMADKSLQLPALHNSDNSLYSSHGSKQRVTRTRGLRNVPQAAHQTRGDQVKEMDGTGKVSIAAGGASIIGIYDHRETGERREYCCLFGMWLEPEDGTLQEHIQEYDNEAARRRRRQTLRKRGQESLGEDVDARMTKRIRRWKECSQE